MVDILQTSLLLIILVLLFTTKLPSKANYSKRRGVVLDSCALIDGRVVELAKSGFLSENLVIPEFILRELQLLADGHDSHKRERARFGLDVVKELQANKYSTVTIDRNPISTKPKTDDKLLELAKQNKFDLYTTDFNLIKLAEIEGIRVLNVNELAQNIRSIVLPGERKTIKIVQKGSNPKQGVGYLDDGTMIVVDNAVRLVGKTVNVEIVKAHQTIAGKMIFANVVNK